MKRLFLFIILSSICFGTANAQKRKVKPKTKKVIIEKTPEQKLYEELLPATAKVMFIDSLVVDKTEFLNHMPMPADIGTIMVEGNKVSYTNEFGNKSIYADGDTLSGRHLFLTHKYETQWEEPRIIGELDNKAPDYPFLMADGVTLYFSAEGEGTVGGRDIFRTTYNADDAKFYEAANIGLPYNSPANEYMLAISDLDNIGWLVTDRYQNEGKVCIYTFERTAQRQTFNEETDEETLKKYAAINAISNTWQFGNRDEAMNRMKDIAARVNAKQQTDNWEFIVDDNTVYTKLTDFKTKANQKKFIELQENKKKLKKLNTLLDTSRQSYAKTGIRKRHEIGRQINALEQEVIALDAEIKISEKELRNMEITKK